MNKILIFLVSVLVLASCSSTKKNMQRGNYDAVINKSVKRLLKDPDNSEDIKTVDRSYKLANERDLERIKFLKMENNPNNYDEIFLRYEDLKARQALVRTILPMNLNGKIINYDYIDYDEEIISFKRLAAEYYYTNGKQLLQNYDRESFRIAYEQLIRAREYGGNGFPNLNELIIQARSKGMSRVFVQVDNSSRILISPDFQQELLSFNTQGLNTDWVEYHMRHLDDEIDYDYLVSIHLMDIAVSPEETKSKDFTYKKEIADGFNYALDARGNVMKDSAGNDIKIPKFKTIQCTLIETSKRKAVQIRGEVEILELKPEKKLLIKRPIGAENIFSDVSARAVGDKDALDDEAKQKIQKEPLPFPNDLQMIFNTAETLKPAIRNAIYLNRRYIR